MAFQDFIECSQYSSISSKMNSLVDSVLSLTIGDQIKNERKALNATKLDALRKSTVASRKVNFIKPSRPDRKGFNSEIIIEKKLADGKSLIRLYNHTILLSKLN